MPGCKRPCNKTEFTLWPFLPRAETFSVWKEDEGKRAKKKKKGTKLDGDGNNFLQKQIGAEGEGEGEGAGRHRPRCKTGAETQRGGGCRRGEVGSTAGERGARCARGWASKCPAGYGTAGTEGAALWRLTRSSFLCTQTKSRDRFPLWLREGEKKNPNCIFTGFPQRLEPSREREAVLEGLCSGVEPGLG